MSNIVIFVEGGVVQGVSSDDPSIEVKVIDFDDLRAEGIESEQRTRALAEATADMVGIY